MLIEKLRDIVGKEFVFDEEEVIRFYSEDFSLTRPGNANFVVNPGDTEEVSLVIKFANENRIPVIPLSSQVHFHGSTIARQGGIIMDLKRINRILELNETERLLRIEPGVTWDRLHQELGEKGYMTIMPLMPHPSRSVFTSFLEREVPLNTRYEFSEPLLSMEVVWPNGDIFRTGSASPPGAPTHATAIGANPEGPGLDWYRLLQGAQGTMGVVTWGIIKIEHSPKENKCFFLPCDRVEHCIEPIYRIQRHMIGNECLALNRINLATILADEWPADFRSLLKSLPSWLIILIISGAPRRPQEKVQYEEKALRRICSQNGGINPMIAIPGVPGVEKALTQKLRRPWEKDIYWKHRFKGNCKDLFFITKLNKVHEFVAEVHALAPEYNYPLDEIGIYIQPIEYGRACHLEFNFFFDPGEQEEVEKVQDLYRKASKRLFLMGAHFTRPYGELAEIVYEKAAAYTSLLKDVKNLLDPNNIMNPGRLCF
ncbi:MAG: FAD-binding oxidoreductase [Thermodesulfobacteriota bacterium]|nr:FAD-binding oxidoreductase [Thermodesulfobacteriota bacterium]